MQELLSLISSYGFPMVLSIYLLIRFETLLRALKESIDTLIVLNSVEPSEKNKIKNRYL